MTIENLKQIAIKYATTKGSRVPLAPDELCNAVVQYFNEFLKITADINTIQVAVTEEGGNIVFTITGNTLDGKAFTPKSYVDNALTNLADVTKENTFTDVNHFTRYITSFGVEIGTGNTDDDEYDVSIQESGIEIFHYISGSKANSLRITENKIMTIVYPSNEYNIFGFPNKSGTLALTSDIIKNPIYFISFYANEPSEPCHLIGTMMSKNSYGTGQKTNEEFAVMLADNLYTNSNEGLAAYGKLAKKDILCIYSDDGLSIRCLDEENSEVDLPTIIFFVMETEL